MTYRRSGEVVSYRSRPLAAFTRVNQLTSTCYYQNIVGQITEITRELNIIRHFMRCTANETNLLRCGMLEINRVVQNVGRRLFVITLSNTV